MGDLGLMLELSGSLAVKQENDGMDMDLRPYPIGSPSKDDIGNNLSRNVLSMD